MRTENGKTRVLLAVGIPAIVGLLAIGGYLVMIRQNSRDIKDTARDVRQNTVEISVMKIDLAVQKNMLARIEEDGKETKAMVRALLNRKVLVKEEGNP